MIDMLPKSERALYSEGLVAGVSDAYYDIHMDLSARPAVWAKGYRDGRRWYKRRAASLMVVEDSNAD